MINDIFSDIDIDINAALYADDGAIWKRGRNINHVIKNMQGALQIVERWSYNWGFKISVTNSCFMLSTRKKAPININISLYGQPLERESEV